MSRSLSDETRATRLKVMFSRSPLASSEDGFSDGKSEKIQHKRTNTGSEASINSGSEMSGKKLQIARRHKSYSSLERLRPSSLAKLSMTATRQHSSPTQKTQSPENEPRRSFNMEENWGKLLHHGEVQVVQSSWRRKHEYLVLTDKFLLRFKNSKRAAEYFPWILPINAQMSRPESPSTKQILEHEVASGNESPIEAPSMKSAFLSLNSIIATHQITETPNRIKIEIQYSDDQCHAHILTVFVERGNGEPHWLENVGDLARQVQMKDGWSISKDLADNIKEVIIDDELEFNLETNRSNVYFLNRRNNSFGHPHVTDESVKETQNMLLLIIARFQIYLIALNKRSHRRLQGEDTKAHLTSYGFVNLVSLSVADEYGSLSLVFRSPQQAPVSFELDSVHSAQIAVEIYEKLAHLVPSSQINPFLFRVPTTLDYQLEAVDHKSCFSIESFASTLKAYCLAYGVNANALRYTVDFCSEDSPSLRLLPPEGDSNPKYSALQLIAFFRSLRYNEIFASICLADISLDCLSEMFDFFGDNHIQMNACIGPKILMTHEEMKYASVLIQELSAMVMSSIALRRLDLSRSICKIPSSRSEKTRSDKGCGVVEAIYPLCINQNTYLDWIRLNGIHLSQTDVDFVRGMLDKSQCQIRGLELSDCHLDSSSLQNIVSELPTQWQTLEVIDLSHNPGQLDTEIFSTFPWRDCISVRRIHLRGTKTFSSFTMSLLPREVLFPMRLEELCLDRTRLNDQTVDTLLEYLATENSRQLCNLSLVGCQLQPLQMAEFMRATSQHMNLHLNLSENETEDLDPVIEAISNNECPLNLTLRLLDFGIPEEFQAFINAVRINSCIQRLDISGAAVGFLISDSRVSDSLQELFRQNCSLEFLDVSGVNSRLDSNNLGGDIAGSLSGLIYNTAMTVLHIEHQKLGIEGANILADVLRENTTLKELHISNNQIPLSGLTALVDSLKENNTLTYLSRLDECKTAALQTIHTVVQEFNSGSRIKPARKALESEEHSGSMNRRIGTKTKDFMGKLAGNKTDGREKDAGGVLSTDLVEKVISDKWRYQQSKMEEYLIRNIHISTEVSFYETNQEEQYINSPEEHQEPIKSSGELVPAMESSIDDKKTSTYVTVQEVAEGASPSITPEEGEIVEKTRLVLKEQVSKLNCEISAE